jgi:hypothetical protein
VRFERGALRVDGPRDRRGSDEPILILRHEGRIRGLAERIVARFNVPGGVLRRAAGRDPA